MIITRGVSRLQAYNLMYYVLQKFICPFNISCVVNGSDPAKVQILVHTYIIPKLVDFRLLK